MDGQSYLETLGRFSISSHPLLGSMVPQGRWYRSARVSSCPRLAIDRAEYTQGTYISTKILLLAENLFVYI